jgi:hypothetical protein
LSFIGTAFIPLDAYKTLIFSIENFSIGLTDNNISVSRKLTKITGPFRYLSDEKYLQSIESLLN